MHNAVNDINYASSRRLARYVTLKYVPGKWDFFYLMWVFSLSETLHPYTPVPLSPSTKAFVSSTIASEKDLKPYQQKELLRTRLLSVAPSAAAFTSHGTGVRSSTFISAGADDNENENDGVDSDLDSGAGDASSLESGFSGSYEADSTRHPQRQVEVSLPIRRAFPTIPPPQENDIMTAISALSQEDSLSAPGSIGSRSFMSYSISVDSAAGTSTIYLLK